MSIEFEVTHPFHPWKGQRLVLANRRQNWGEDRVVFYDAEGQLRSMPATWTDLDPPDIRSVVAAGDSFFRVDDLLVLVGLISEIKGRPAGRPKGVKQIAPHV